MKNIKKEMRWHSFFDFDGMAGHFEKMAAKGWILENVTKNRYIYKKDRPRKIKYAVTYYADRSDFDPKITEGQMDFNQFCAAAGWQFVGSISQMHIYQNRNENPLPLETEPVVQVKNVHRAMKRNFLPGGWLIIILSLLIIAMYTIGVFKNPTFQLVDDSPMFIVLIYTTLAVLMAREMSVYYRWKFKATWAAAEGVTIASGKSNPKFQIAALVWVLMLSGIYVANMLSWVKPTFLIATYTITGGAAVITMCISSFLKKLNFSRNMNRLVSFILPFVWTFALIGLLTTLIVKNDIDIRQNRPQPVDSYNYLGIEWDVYNEDIPLKVEDIIADISADSGLYSYEIESKEGIFAAKYEIRQQVRRDLKMDMPELVYDIYKTKFDWAYNLLLKDLYSEHHRPHKDIPAELQDYLVEQNRQEWQADKVWRVYFNGQAGNEYLICIGDKIIEMRIYFEPDTQIKGIIGEKLTAF